MPFVTEEIWHKLPGNESSIMNAEFPKPADFLDDNDAIKEMELLMGVINGIRNIRGEMNIPPSKGVSVIIDMAGQEDSDTVNRNLNHIKILAKVDDASVVSDVPKPKASATAVFGQNQVHVLLKGLLDFDEERKRLRKEIQKIEKEISASDKKLSNKQFLEKAPADIVAKVKEKVEAQSLKLDKLNQNLSFLEKIDD
jgi:valyl-tRNA synthetase